VHGESWLSRQLFEIGGTPVTASTLSTVFAILVVTWITSWLVRRAVERAAGRAGMERRHTAGVTRLVGYVVTITGVAIALQTAGVKLTALFTAGAVFAVGVGFAMQNIAQNFLSGVILLAERSIKPGDVLEVSGQLVQVEQIGIRTTLVRTREEEALIVPNSSLVQSTVKNYTLRDMNFRLRVTVGVTYSSDMALVRQLIEQVGRSFDWRDAEREPVVLLIDFGASSVDWELSVWTHEPWRQRQHASLVREAIWNVFQEAGVVIAFPQLDVHFDPPVTDAITRRAA
jgi:small-conductance mechanosensitive channel